MDVRKAPSRQTLDRLREAAGPSGYTDDPAIIAPHLKEWRDRFVGATPALLRPASTDAVARIVGICHETGTALVPQGGNTGLVGGQIPSADGSEVLLSLARMNTIRSVDPGAGTLTAEAGCILDTVQKAADANDRLFPLSLASEGSATIGGLVSTNAGGTAVLAYGNMRDLVLGLEAVLPDGRIWHGLRALRKDNTGYDLKNLLIGAEGTLGIVTAAVLKLFPRPTDMATAFIGLASVDKAVQLLNRVRAAGLFVTTFELIPRIGLEFVGRHVPGARKPIDGEFPWYVLLEVSLFGTQHGAETQALLIQAQEEGLLLNATLATSSAQRQAFWQLRDALSEAQKPEGGSIKHDVSVPVSSIPEFIEVASRAVCDRVPGARPVPFGHIGDGNIHFNISQPAGGDKAQFLGRIAEINMIVHDLVRDFQGSISAEHGLGQAKVDEILRYKSHAEIDAMRAIKRALDPKGIMNPGKVVRV